MTEQNELTLFNMAMACLNRINKLLSTISSAYMIGDPMKMGWALRALFREIAPKLSDEERTEFHTMFAEAIKSKMDRSMFFKYLETIDVWLRDKLEERGMLIPSAKDRRYFSGIK